MLAIIETHPVQYHAPVYRAVQQQFGIPVTAVYGSDFSIAGYRDREFGASFAWDTDLVSGYSSVFLRRVADGGGDRSDAVSADGLRAALARIQPEAVLVLGYSPQFHRSAWFEARRTGRPVLFRGETSDGASARGALKAGLRRAALALAYRSCDRLLYIGVRSREHFLRHGVPPERLVFSPYCVDTAPFDVGEAARDRLRPVARQRLGAGAGDVVVLFSGKLSRRKGVDLLPAAIRRLPGELRARVVLVLLGDGESRSALESQAAERPAVRTVFAGFQNQTQLSPYYHAADVLVLPSRHSETWGLVVNEALQHGVPCVVSDRVGCAPDLVAESTGAVCDAEDVDSLAHAMAVTIRRGTNEPVRAACRRRVANYSVEHAAEGIAIAFRTALEIRRLRGRAS